MTTSVIVGVARTPIGKMSGQFANQSAADLGAVAIAGALERAGVAGDQVDYVVMGQVLQAGAGQNPARPAAVKAGIPMTTPSITINKVCLSGLNAIAQADWMVRLGEADIVVAGGMESMTQAPYILTKARGGYRYGDGKLIDTLSGDALWCTFEQKAMGEATDLFNQARWNFSRAEQDEFSARSHELAAAAQKNGAFAEEIVPVSVPQRKGDPLVIDEDEGIRPGTSGESLGKLPAAFVKDGTVTAGNASQISDGAAALVVMSAEKAAELGCTVLGEILSVGQVAGEDGCLQAMPARAIEAAAAKVGVAVGDIDLFELNEAFAAVGLSSAKEMDIPVDKVNVNGGAIAIGHPLGMSGARIVLSGLLEQRRRGGGLVAAGLCGGGGQGDAMLVRAV
jgi:acetyl-CoA C-acetyltransferase